LEEISKLLQSIIIIVGLDPKSSAFLDLKDKAWHRFEKIITDETFRGMAENFPEQFIQMHKLSNPRNPSKPSVQERISTDPEERYERLVELINNRATMKEIAIAFGLSLPSAYLIRNQYKDQLLSDPNVKKDQKLPALRFNGKRSE
jgi:hypothetical protein